VLDAIISTGPIPGADDATIRALLGSGVALLIHAPAKPDERWPWQRHGESWLLRYQPLGPSTALSESAYAPTLGWSPGLSTRTRATILAAAVFFAIAVLAVSLVRRRALLIGGLILATATMLTIVRLWSKRLPSSRQAEGSITILGEQLLQRDLWTFQTATRNATVSYPCQPQLARPLLTSPEQASRQRLTLEIDAAGEPQRWTASLPGGEKLAFLRRVVEPAGEEEPYSTARDSPMQLLVRQAYAGPAVRVIGQSRPQGDHNEDSFAELILRREAVPPATP
jgi:hypothetical protein